MPKSDDEMLLAHAVGRALGGVTREVRLGGYNGLMEEVSRGVAEVAGRVVAPHLAATEVWGEMNQYVHEVVPCATPGDRINFYLAADAVIALPGGVGSLYEIAAALWHTTSYAPIPIWLLGRRCRSLYELLRDDGWLVETPTRSTAHIELLRDDTELAQRLNALSAVRPS
jgi:hypothetical protein